MSGIDGSPNPSEGSGTAAGRRFEERYGTQLVRRGIATYPTVLLRSQHELGLTDGEIVTLMHVFSFYRHRGTPANVSPAAIAKARGVKPTKVEADLKDLVSRGLITLPGAHAVYRTPLVDISPLLEELERRAEQEAQRQEILDQKAEERIARRRAKRSPSEMANRENTA